MTDEELNEMANEAFEHISEDVESLSNEAFEAIQRVHDELAAAEKEVANHIREEFLLFQGVMSASMVMMGHSNEDAREIAKRIVARAEKVLDDKTGGWYSHMR